MKKRHAFRRVLCTALTLTLLPAFSTKVSEEKIIEISVELTSATSSCILSKPIQLKHMQKAATTSPSTDTVASCIADATWGEFLSILSFLRGENPTAGKDITMPGQNTKNNVALTLIEMIRGAKAVRNLDFVLKPLSDKKGIKELYAVYTPLFSKNAEEYATGVLFDYNTKTIYRTDGTGILGIGYDFNFDFNTFSSSDDPWQRNFGFCETYDHLAFTIGDIYSTIRVPFSYNGKDWMIQIWKGVYSFNMLGGEIGVYTKPTSRTAKFYDCANDLEKLPISFSIYNGDEKIAETALEDSWWQTAFTYHAFKNPNKLTMCATIRFPDKAMLKAFTDSLSKADSSVQITTSGLSVSFTWPASK